MKIKITTTIENIVETDKLSGFTKQQIKKQIKRDLKIAQKELIRSVLSETKKVINTKSHRERLNHLKASAIQDFDDLLNYFLNECEPQKHTDSSAHP